MKKLQKFGDYINENFEPIKEDAINEELSPTDDIVSPEGENVDMVPVFDKYADSKDEVFEIINKLEWEPVTDGMSVPAGPGLSIKGVIRELGIPKVDQIAYTGEPPMAFAPKDEPGASLSVCGIQGKYKHGKVRFYFVDAGGECTPICAVHVDGRPVSESLDDFDKDKLNRVIEVDPTESAEL